jgi:hypothetical protein
MSNEKMRITEQLKRIEQLIMFSSKVALTTSELSIMIGLSVGRIRHLVSERKIPHYKQGNKTFFRKSEIENWMLAQKVPTLDEIEVNAATYVATNNAK